MECLDTSILPPDGLGLVGGYAKPMFPISCLYHNFGESATSPISCGGGDPKNEVCRIAQSNPPKGLIRRIWRHEIGVDSK